MFVCVLVCASVLPTIDSRGIAGVSVAVGRSETPPINLAVRLNTV